MYLKHLKLRTNILYAPLAGCSDLPFRKMTSAYRPGLLFCEMVKMDALIRNDAGTLRMLDYEKEMHPIGAQLCGSKLELAAPCAKMIEDLGFDVLDFNCGCPVDKVTKDGSGSGMLKNPQLIGEIIAEMAAAVNIPVTVKIRTGWDEAHINAVEITRIAEEAGAAAITIHGRTRAQGYSGSANWDHIRACKAAAKNIKVIGNGDLFDADSVLRIFQHTGCDGVLIARGTMGHPWIIEDIEEALAGRIPRKRTGFELRDAYLQHMEYIIAYNHERKAVLDLRRVGCWYFKGGKNVKQLREKINRSQSTAEVYAHIQEYPWDEFESSPSSLELAQTETTC